MKTMKCECTAHLVGSIGLGTVDEVFQAVGDTLGRHVRRVPDGEVGGRRLWISWQYAVLRSQPFLTPDPGGAVRPTNRFPLLTLAADADVAQVRFGELGYAREARASYLDFLSARERGVIPAGVRFQVCLPTPFAVVSSVVVRSALPVVEMAYERAMRAEVEALCRHIPHDDLCIQWDVCNEMVIWDGQISDAVPYPDEPRTAIIERLSRLIGYVPEDVEVGVHLCYGDFGGHHFVEPRTAEAMVEFANLIMTTAPRPLSYIHMPVPMSRDDIEFYAPFRDLQLPDGTELYLGLIHVQDGVEGARKRRAVAERYAPPFGVATECGMARARTEATVKALLNIHAELCRAD
jgi:methionine synthase II (cobalamin-independent)